MEKNNGKKCEEVKHLWKIKEIEYENIINLINKGKAREWLDMTNINIITFNHFPLGRGNERFHHIPWAKFCKFRLQHAHLEQHNAIDFFEVAVFSNSSVSDPCRAISRELICKYELNYYILGFTITLYKLCKYLLVFLFEFLLLSSARNL